jgi:hypothetical protein
LEPTFHGQKFSQLLDEISHNRRSLYQPPDPIVTERRSLPRPPLLPAPVDDSFLYSPPPPVLREERNTETPEPVAQSQGNHSSSWFGVVTKVVSKADTAVLSLVDRLPSMSSSTRGEGTGNEPSIQECQSCDSRTPNGVNELMTENFLQVCIRKQCKCKCHQSPVSLVQARRNHGALQRNSNKKSPLARRSSVQQILDSRENNGPSAGEGRPPVHQTLLMRIMAAEAASVTKRNSERQQENNSPTVPLSPKQSPSPKSNSKKISKKKDKKK